MSRPAQCRLENYLRFMLSGGMAFRNDEIGMARPNPRLLHSGHLLEPADFVFVRSRDQLLSRRLALRFDPTLIDPVVDLLRNDAQLPSEVRNPPFVLFSGQSGLEQTCRIDDRQHCANVVVRRIHHTNKAFYKSVS